MINRVYIFLLVVASAMPYRFEYSLGPFSTISVLDVVLVFGLMLLSLNCIRRGRIYVANTRVFACIFIPVCIAFLSFVWSSGIDSTSKYIIKIGFGLIIYLVLVNLAKNFPERLIRKLWVIFCCCCLIGTIGFYLGVPGFKALELKNSTDSNLIISAYMRISNPFLGRAPDYGPILAFCAFIMMGYTMIHFKRWYAFLSFLMTFAVFLTFTRGIILGFIVALVYFAFAMKFSAVKIIKNTFKPALVIIILAAIIIYNFNITVGDNTRDLKQIMLEDRTNLKNVDSRLEIYDLMISKIIESPVVGYGGGVFEQENSEGDAIAAHNSYLQMLLFYGIPLGLLSIFVLLYHFYVYWKWPLISPQAKTMAVALASGIITILLSAMTQPFLEASVPRVLLGFLMGLGTLTIIAMEREYREGQVLINAA